MIKYKILEHKQVSSTNAIIKDLLNTDKPAEFTAILAGFQNSGRGQAGNSWQSEPNKNLLLSVILYPEFLALQYHYYLSKIVSLAITESMSDFGIDVKIKWPNDIYWQNLKLCGILIENGIMGANISHCVVGTGMNINQTKFPKEIPNPVSMQQISRKEFNLKEVAEVYLNHLQYYYGMLKAGELKSIDNAYFNHLYDFKIKRLFKDQNGAFTGRIINVLAGGKLVVEHPDGTKKEYMFKEIEFL